jgi:hypothetical protein
MSKTKKNKFIPPNTINTNIPFSPPPSPSIDERIEFLKKFARTPKLKSKRKQKINKEIFVERKLKNGKIIMEKFEIKTNNKFSKEPPLIKLKGRKKSGYIPEYDDYLIDLRIKCQKRSGEAPKGDLEEVLNALGLSVDSNCWDMKKRIWKYLNIREDPIRLRDERLSILERNFDNAADIPILAKREGKLILRALNLDENTTRKIETENCLFNKILEIHKTGILPRDIIHQPDVIEDINQHKSEFSSLPITEQEAIIKARRGQGIFRDNLIMLWGGCSVTGLQIKSILKASHIKPWRDSSNSERLNGYNGLLLIPNLDTLFDAGYITFEDSGLIIISKNLSPADLRLLNIFSEMSLRKIFPQNLRFLRYHREEIFERKF